MSYADIDPVYKPIEQETYEKQDLQEEDQHDINNSVCLPKNDFKKMFNRS